MQMAVVMSRLEPNVNTAERRKHKRKNRRMLFSKKKHYQTPYKQVCPFLGWQAQQEEFHGFSQAEVLVANAQSQWLKHEISPPAGRVKSISMDNNVEYTFTLSPIPKLKLARVLSLCDGIATGLVILQELNIPVEHYFSSEIDGDCRNDQRCRHPSKLIALGDVEKLAQNKDLLFALLPVNIVFASPPCVDLSLLNPNRREWNAGSSAFRTQDCMRIIRFLEQKMSGGSHPFFWLLEQTAHMSVPCRERLLREVGEPCHIICSSSHSASYRRRAYFGNIPYLAENAASCVGRFSGQPLQTFLEPYRVARTIIAPCLTSNVSLQKRPVQNVDSGEWDTLSVPEMERLMGLCGTYTAVGNLSIRSRQSMLGRAWNLFTLKYILKPLKDFFEAGQEQSQVV